MKLVKNLFDLFEIIVVMCITKFKKLESEDELLPIPIDSKMSVPNLERRQSTVDETSTQEMIVQAFDVIFKELKSA